uniref:Uncharacterized protein n=1 Tax=Arundo donax TaxID=35708 RepID=A0A0A9CQI8_ARUDO
MPARHRHRRDTVQRGDHGRGPVQQRARPGHLLQLVLRLPLRVLHRRRHGHRLPPGRRLLGPGLRCLPRDNHGEPGHAAHWRAVLPDARGEGQPIHGARARCGGRGAQGSRRRQRAGASAVLCWRWHCSRR